MSLLAPLPSPSLVLVLVGLVACAPDGPLTPGVPTQGVGRAVEGSLARIDNGDGTWSYSVPADFDPEERLVERIITWRYAGQASFAHKPVFSGAERTFVEQGRRELTWLESLQRFRRTDAQGRTWVVEWADRDALSAVTGKPVPDTWVEDESEFAAGTEVTWQPMSWDHYDCDGLGGNETHLWEGEDRTLVACQGLCSGEQSGSPMDPFGRQKAAVQVNHPGGTCSGTLVRNMWVLTAAHCVSDDNNVEIPAGGVSVCRYDDNEACSTGAEIYLVDPGYNGGSSSGGGTDFDDDFALIKLASSWTSLGSISPETMNLASLNDSALGALTKVHEVSNPGYARYCGAALGGDLYHTVEYEPIAGIGSDYVRLKIDASPGQSGGAWYTCPAGVDEDCEFGDPGEIFGVHAGYNSLLDRAVGAKIPGQNRTDLLAILP